MILRSIAVLIILSVCAGSISAYTNISRTNSATNFVAVPYDEYLEIESNLSNCWNTIEANEILIADRKQTAKAEAKKDFIQYLVIIGEFIVILLMAF
jgi:hypothetical protein